MKRYFLSIILCLPFTLVLSQNRFGLRVGGSKTNIHLDDGRIWQPLDWQIHLLAEFDIAANVWLQPEMGLSSRHSYYYTGGVSHYLFDHYDLTQWEGNLLVKYPVLDRRIKILPLAGLNLGYVLSGRRTYSYGSVGPVSGSDTERLDFNNGDFQYDRFFWGPVLGLSWELSLTNGVLVLDSRFNRFAEKISGCGSCDAVIENRISIGLGYFFGQKQDGTRIHRPQTSR